jgi:hypothetical protein
MISLSLFPKMVLNADQDTLSEIIFNGTQINPELLYYRYQNLETTCINDVALLSVQIIRPKHFEI